MLIIFFVIANLICSTLVYANEDIAFYKAYRTAKSRPKTFYKVKPPSASHQAISENSPWPTTPCQQPLINLNTATVEALQAIPSIGREHATHIIAYRDQLPHARFTSIEQLLEVPGFSPQLLKQIRAHIII